MQQESFTERWAVCGGPLLLPEAALRNPMASWIMGGQELFLPSACTWVLGHVPIQ